MCRLSIHVDFMNADPQGRLRLTCVGTTRDLARLGVRLDTGLRIVVTDGELEADAEVVFSDDEHDWVAVIDWDAIRRLA